MIYMQNKNIISHLEKSNCGPQKIIGRRAIRMFFREGALLPQGPD